MNDFLVAGTNKGVVIAQQKGDIWKETSRSLPHRQVNSLSVLGGIILAGTNAGIFRTDDLGHTWFMTSQGMTEPHVRWLAFHPDGSGSVLVGTEPAAIFLSQDSGISWAECMEVARLRRLNGWYLPYSPEAGCVRGFAFNDNQIYAAVEQGGLLRSDDAGASWRLVDGSEGVPQKPPANFIHPDVHSVVVHPTSPDMVFASTGGGLYRSVNGGSTWDHLYSCYCRAVWVDPADENNLVFGPARSVDRGGRIERSIDGGETWENSSSGLETPWSHHMVERFFQAGNELFAILSNGSLLAAPLEDLQWQYILPEAEGVRSLALMEQNEKI